MKLEEEFSYSEWAKRPAIANRSQNQDALYETLKANADSLAAGATRFFAHITCFSGMGGFKPILTPDS